MELVCERAYRVASHTVGPRGVLRPSALLGFLEDAAGEHASAWHLSLPDLLPRGLMWVLTRYHLRLLRSPRYGEQLQVTTWPSGRGGRAATRDFEVRDAAGETVALATTSWAVLDVARRRPRLIDDVVPAGFVLDRRAIADDFLPLPTLDGSAHQLTLPVMHRDLDLNQHVNHAVYLEWALESIPADSFAATVLRDTEIAFLGEAKLGDHVISATATLPDHGDGTRLMHRITNAATGRELARLRTAWTG